MADKNKPGLFLSHEEIMTCMKAITPIVIANEQSINMIKARGIELPPDLLLTSTQCNLVFSKIHDYLEEHGHMNCCGVKKYPIALAQAEVVQEMINEKNEQK